MSATAIAISVLDRKAAELLAEERFDRTDRLSKLLSAIEKTHQMPREAVRAELEASDGGTLADALAALKLPAAEVLACVRGIEAAGYSKVTEILESQLRHVRDEQHAWDRYLDGGVDG
jgi:hypothetical protein